MKTKGEFAITKVAEDYVAVPVDNSVLTLRGIVRLNDTGKYIWDRFSEGYDEVSTAEKMTEVYDIGLNDALRDVSEIACKLRAAGLIDE